MKGAFIKRSATLLGQMSGGGLPSNMAVVGEPRLSNLLDAATVEREHDQMLNRVQAKPAVQVPRHLRASQQRGCVVRTSVPSSPVSWSTLLAVEASKLLGNICVAAALLANFFNVMSPEVAGWGGYAAHD